ncbi:MAG TPA: ATP-binding protein [Anaerolineaceae bacterium]
MYSLRTRLILSHIFPILVILPLIGGIFLYLLQSQVYLANAASELDRQAVVISDIAGGYAEIWRDPERSQAFVENLSLNLAARVQLMDGAGRLIASSDPEDENRVGQVIFTPNYEQYLSGGKHAVVTYRDNTIQDVTVPVINILGQLAGFVRLENPLASVSARYAELRRSTLGILAGGLILGVVLGWLLAYDLEKPLRSTTQAVYELGSGRKLTPLKEQGPEEMRMLQRSFNGLVERLRTLEESRRRLLANLVHELGRPLGAMQSAVTALAGGADEDAQLRRELLGGMNDEVHRMRSLVDDLAQLYEQVLGSLELDLRSTDLNDWLARVIAPWREAALDKKLEWRAEIAAGLPTLAIDPDRLAQALGNLLSNAVRYTPEGGLVSVSAESATDGVRIHVSDTGPGIQAEERERIFTPFYRGSAVRRFSDGMGIGLTIAQDLVKAHGGSLQLDSQPGKGSRFTIFLPAQPQKTAESTSI